MQPCDQVGAAPGMRCVQCEVPLSAEDASMWWCAEDCFEEWQAHWCSSAPAVTAGTGKPQLRNQMFDADGGEEASLGSVPGPQDARD